MGLKGVSLSVVTTNDADVEALNGRWRGKDTATDVLSFPQIAREDELLPGITLGDIVVSLETANRQAADRGHSLLTELRILLIHGLCHLLGYDHTSHEGAKEMADLENRLLRVMTGSLESSTPGLIQLVGRNSDV